MIEFFFKMPWLHDWVTKGVELFSLSNQLIEDSLIFFIYDVIKIFILLIVFIYFVSVIQSYFPVEQMKGKLSKKHGLIPYVLAALFGTITPFCSCSSIPLFIGFTRAKLPIGVTFAFLISSPLVDLASILLISSYFGGAVAIWYTVVGILLAVVGGILIDVIGFQDQVESFVFGHADASAVGMKKMSFLNHLEIAKDETLDIVKRVWKYILIGVGIGAIVHNWIPQDIILMLLGDHFFSVPLAVLLGTPVYADIFGTIPIAEALLFHGVGLGTILAFMMAVTTLSIPSIILLKKVVKTKLLLFFIGYVVLGIMLIGFLFNAFL